MSFNLYFQVFYVSSIKCIQLLKLFKLLLKLLKICPYMNIEDLILQGEYILRCFQNE